MLKKLFLAAVFSVFPAVLLAADYHSDDSLYARMGGATVIARVVDQFLELSRTDPRTSRSFKKVNMKRLREKLNEKFCALAQGPCEYTGDSMKDVHAGLDITEAEFNAGVEHLRTVLDGNRVGQREKNELLKLLAPIKRDTVTK